MAVAMAADRVTPAIAAEASMTTVTVTTAKVEGRESSLAVTFVLDIDSPRNGVTQSF